MDKRSCRSIAGLVLVLVAGLARANTETVTFDDLPRHRSATDLHNTVHSGGFTFISDSDLYAPGRRERADPHGQTLASLNADGGLVAVPDSGLAFTLVSLDLGIIPAVGSGRKGDANGERGDDGSSAGSPVGIELVYLIGTDPTVQTRLLELDNEPGLQTFELGLQDVVGFGLFGAPFQLDNVVTEPYAAPSAVPETSALAALLAGLAMLALVSRRRAA